MPRLMGKGSIRVIMAAVVISIQVLVVRHVLVYVPVVRHVILESVPSDPSVRGVS